MRENIDRQRQGSSFSGRVPDFFRTVAMVPSVMLSPIDGTTTVLRVRPHENLSRELQAVASRPDWFHGMHRRIRCRMCRR